MSTVRLSARKPHYDSEENVCPLLEADETDAREDFTENAKKGDASVIVTVVFRPFCCGRYFLLQSLMPRGTAHSCPHWQRTSCSGSSRVG